MGRMMRALHDPQQLSLWMVDKLMDTATTMDVVKVTKDRQGGFVPSTVQIVCGFGVQNVMKRQADIMGVDAKAVRKIWKQKENHKTRLENLEPTHKALPVINLNLYQFNYLNSDKYLKCNKCVTF